MEERRRESYEHPVQEATEESIFGGLGEAEFYEKHGVEHEEEYIEMSSGRGLRTFKQRWEPRGAAARASVLVLHGFSEDSSWLVQLTAVGIAKRGYSVHAFDFPGHGRSDGPPAHVPDLTSVVDSALHVSRLILFRRPNLPLFLYAESLGAAVALLAHLRTSASDPTLLAGAILQGAMCGISRRFLLLPPGPTLVLAALAARLLPTWRLCPTPDNVAASYAAAWKRALVRKNPLKTAVRPDAATGYDMMRVARFLQSQAHLVSLPFLAIHGDDDRVCDLACVQALFDKAASTDKTLKVYRGMGHMFVGESKELTDTVFSDMIAWLEERTPPAPSPHNHSS